MKDEKLAFVVTLGDKDREHQGLYLINSILKFHEEPEIYAFLPEEEKETMNQEVLKDIESKKAVQMLEGKMTIPEYPLSAAHNAMYKASQKTDREYLLALDTDTILVDKITVHQEHDADLFLKPEDLSYLFYQSEESQEDWERIVEDREFEVPALENRSTEDRGRMRNYYNGGFILTRNNDFPERYMELCKELHGNLEVNFVTDQVALALLAQDYELHELDCTYNYSVGQRLRLRKDVKMLHYHVNGYGRMFKWSILPQHRWLWERLSGTGFVERYQQEKWNKPFVEKAVKSVLRPIKVALIRTKNRPF